MMSPLGVHWIPSAAMWLLKSNEDEEVLMGGLEEEKVDAMMSTTN